MSDEKIIKSFNFCVPVELYKSDATDTDSEVVDDWKIGGIASTADKDLQGEEVIQDGLDIEALKAGRGLFNNDHQRGPENVIGQIEDAEFIDQNGSKALIVKGYLFKHQPRAQAYYNIMKSIKKGSPSRVHFSIEGKIVERDMMQTSKIKKARIDKVALTMDPVNPNTFADLVKSMTDEKEKDEFEILLKEAVDFALSKALAAGIAGTKAPGEMTSGESMTKESMDKKPKNMSYDKKKKKQHTVIVKSIIDHVLPTFSEQDPIEVTNLICKLYESKIKGA